MATNVERAHQLSIRRATEADCDALTALMLRSAAYRGRYQAMIARYPVTPTMVRKGEVWIAEQDESIVGFYRLDLAEADLDLMFVDDGAQGTGVGRTMLEHMARFAAEHGVAKVRIVSHPPAADFYRRMGAKEVGICKAKGGAGWDRPILELAVL